MKKLFILKSFALSILIFTNTTAWSYQIECSPEKAEVGRGGGNIRQLIFHNDGGIWTGFSKAYISFRLASNGGLYDFDFQENEVLFMELSENHYQAIIKVSKLYKEDLLVKCNIRS